MRHYPSASAKVFICQTKFLYQIRRVKVDEELICAFLVSRLKFNHAEKDGVRTSGLDGADKMELVWFSHADDRILPL